MNSNDENGVEISEVSAAIKTLDAAVIEMLKMVNQMEADSINVEDCKRPIAKTVEEAETICPVVPAVTVKPTPADKMDDINATKVVEETNFIPGVINNTAMNCNDENGVEVSGASADIKILEAAVIEMLEMVNQMEAYIINNENCKRRIDKTVADAEKMFPIVPAVTVKPIPADKMDDINAIKVVEEPNLNEVKKSENIEIKKVEDLKKKKSPGSKVRRNVCITIRVIILAVVVSAWLYFMKKANPVDKQQ